MLKLQPTLWLYGPALESPTAQWDHDCRFDWRTFDAWIEIHMNVGC